jgi:aminodeoxyfutalosine deaminase
MWVRAKHVFPVVGGNIKNGAVRVDRGRIVEIGSGKDATGGAVLDFGDAVVLPGFVNAHTHLELSHLRGAVKPTRDFFDWLGRLLTKTNEPGASEQTFVDAARDGARESLLAGVTTAGDVTARPTNVRAEQTHGPLRVVSFGEVIAIGRSRNRLGQRLQAAIDDREMSRYLSIGVSPHSPYTIEQDGVRACVETGEVSRMRMCMHLAETRDEVQFTEYGDGRVREYLQTLGVWDQAIRCPQMSPVPLAHRYGLLTSRTVLAHANYVSEADITLIAAHGAHVAYCPRTHAAFEHPPHTYQRMLSTGVNVCVATDSLASNPSLSVLDEARFIRSIDEAIEGEELISMATLRGARALGLDRDIGSIEVGKCADIVVVPLDPQGPTDPIENILRSQAPPIAIIVRGRRLNQTGR